MRNIGSISDQTIGGLISTASHGSGVTFPVLSQHVKSLKLALPLPGAPIVTTSASEDVELFKATLCGLGATGLILEVEIEIEDAFRLRETKTPCSVDEALDNLDKIKGSSEHTRLWWYPDGQGMVVGRANRVYEVCFEIDIDGCIQFANNAASRTYVLHDGSPAWLPPHPSLSVHFAHIPIFHPMGWQVCLVAGKCGHSPGR
jgi:hypothetical protein